MNPCDPRSVDVAGRTMNVVDRGRGPVVLLVHGFPLDHRMWSAQCEALEGRYRVVAPDLRGFGGTPATPGTITTDQFADDLADLLDALGVREPICYCGLSMGGYIGWSFVRRHRRRLAALVLCDTRSAADTPEVARGRLQLASTVLSRGSDELVDAMIPRLVDGATPGRQPEVIAALTSMIRTADPEGIAAALRGMAGRVAADDLLSTIDVPTLALVGASDAITPPAEMRALAAAITGARLVEVPQAGHMAPLENPAVTNRELLAWLGSVAGFESSPGGD